MSARNTPRLDIHGAVSCRGALCRGKAARGTCLQHLQLSNIRESRWEAGRCWGISTTGKWRCMRCSGGYCLLSAFWCLLSPFSCLLSAVTPRTLLTLITVVTLFNLLIGCGFREVHCRWCAVWWAHRHHPGRAEGHALLSAVRCLLSALCSLLFTVCCLLSALCSLFSSHPSQHPLPPCRRGCSA
jgi:hypothetical protein